MSQKLVVVTASALLIVIVGSIFSTTYEDRRLYKNGEVRRDHTATVISEGEGLKKRLLVNGIGMTILTPITKIMAHLPLAFQKEKPTSGLVICFGMGTTFRSLASWGITAKAVELVPSVKDAFGFYFSDAGSYLNHPKAQIIVDDGRRFLKRSDEKFDIITVDPPPPIEAAGSSLLYSEEFLSLIKLHLRDDGILQVWFPGGEKKVLQAVARSLSKSFPHVMVFRSIENWGYHFLASNRPIIVPAVDEMLRRMPKGAQDDLMEWYQTQYTLWAWPPKKQDIRSILSNQLSKVIQLSDIISPNESLYISDDKPYNEYFLLRRVVDFIRGNYERL